MLSEFTKTSTVLLSAVLVMLLGVLVIYPSDFTPTDNTADNTIQKFNSKAEIENFLKEQTQIGNYWGGGIIMESTMDMAVSKSVSINSGSTPTAQGSTDFSTTNIQVEGVDEADIVKNDGKYIYTLSGNTLAIVDAYPAQNAQLVSNITIDGYAQEIYINDDKLVVLGNKNIDYLVSAIEPKSSDENPEIATKMMPIRRSSTLAFAKTYDISDKENPKLIKTTTIDGNYHDSRMIGDTVYIIATQYTYYGNIRIPEIQTTLDEKTTNKTLDVYYFNVPDNSYSFTSIVSLNVKDDKKESTGKIYLLGSTRNLYVSMNNIYVTYQKQLPRTYFYEQLIEDVVMPLMPKTVTTQIEIEQTLNKSEWEKQQATQNIIQDYSESLDKEEQKTLEEQIEVKMEELQQRIAKETEKTIIHKIAIDNGNIEYKKTGEVSGRVLNQFSMDEYDNHFRIATTTGRVTRAGAQTSANHIYVLDSNLKLTGALEDIAPGESIYSARFMGKKAYLVTFQKIDPLFVIDLSAHNNPKILGKLKIPGYSDYLHPYDENHIIGIGKDAKPAEEGDFAWYQGVKLALFDVTDVNNPKELSVYKIGDRGTDSYALQDHKAFLFSKDKNLLVIPILLAEIDESKYADGLPEWAYGDYIWQGAYVFNIDTKDGITLNGKITHSTEDDDTFAKSGWYYSGSIYSVKRSLYMDNTLYTISNGMIKANSLDNMDEIKAIKLPITENQNPYDRVMY